MDDARYSSAPLIDRILEPFRRFARTEAAGGLVLLVATAIALVWANSRWAPEYFELWETTIAVSLGGMTLSTSLHHFVNDGLMAVFFFVVGLEIKRELIAGELASMRRAALPMIGALGGMVVPATLYALVVGSGPEAAGWGVPMATDIAFALGVLALLGKRVPTGLKIFLAALAIVDDIGAILVIAVFYAGGVDWSALVSALAILLLAAGANRAGARHPWLYGILGLALWGTVLTSGIHATVAGVLLALTIPVRTRLDEASFLAAARQSLDHFDNALAEGADNSPTVVLANAEHQTALEEIETLAEQAQPPLIRIEHALHGVVAFAIMPLFALANAGVSLGAGAVGAAFASPVTLGIALGLVLGKPIGIWGFCWLAVRARVAALPDGITWPMIAGAGILGGIGFTMALFIAGLAFPDGTLIEAAKVGVLGASAIAAVAGSLLLRLALGRASSPQRDL